MTHFLDKKYKSQISDKDFDILFSGKKKRVENPVFGESSRDYIEMNIFNTNGNFLESIRVGEVKEYIDTEGEFNINPGIILRRNGYFSGDYNIEFNFLREIAGSNQTVLVDSNKEIYTGEYDVLIDGRIVKKGTTRELTELDYKYYIEDISSDKKEVRLATLPIKNDRYKQEFKSLAEKQATIYPKDIGQDVLNFDNLSLKPPSTEFVLNNNSNITLDKSLIGSELIINDAYEIMDLTEFGAENDGFAIFLQSSAVSEWVTNQQTNRTLATLLPTTQTKQFLYGAYKAGNSRINFGDKDNLSTEDDFRNYCFNDLAIDDGKDAKSSASKKLSNIATELKSNLGNLSSGRPFLGGAYIMGYKTSKTFGFPFIIATTISDLDKIQKLSPELTIKIKGIDLVSGNEFESTFNPKYYGNETKGTIPIPTDHKRFGGLYSAEFNLEFDVNGTRRGLKIYRPNLFAVIPDYKISNEESEPAEEFIRQGFNY